MPPPGIGFVNPANQRWNGCDGAGRDDRVSTAIGCRSPSPTPSVRQPRDDELSRLPRFAIMESSLYGSAAFAKGGGVSDIIREVDEELRRENYEKLWRKYGSYVLGLAILAVLIVAAGLLWRDHMKGQREDRARLYEAALQMVAAADPGAPAALQGIASGDDGYAALAQLQAAALKAKAGDIAGTVAIYEKMTADSAIDESLRNLALMLLALYTADTAPPDQLTQRLKPLTSAANPWHYSALELTAVLARRAGDTAKAEQILTGLADDLNAPQALRQRATEMLHALKG
jgi:hypothetical protein